MGVRVEEKIKQLVKYWQREPLDYPLTSFWIAPDFLVSTHFDTSKKLLRPGEKIFAEMVYVDGFIEDYKQTMFEMSNIDQDSFWAVEPFIGFPWIEAICGCEVFAQNDSFITKPYLDDIKDLSKIKIDFVNPWYRKYIEFVDKLTKNFGNDCPVAQPILRGVSDVMGALVGQEKMVYAMYDSPDDVKRLMSKINDVFLELLKEHQKRVQPFQGGYTMGFYHLWSPGKCAWFQEDLSSLMAPEHYRNFIRYEHERICKTYDYTAIHLHSSSFHMIDEILEVKGLKTIEINKDVGGLTISEMTPVFKKVQTSGRNLIIWGSLEPEDIDCVKNNLEMKGIFLNLVVPDVSTARSLYAYVKDSKTQ